MVKRIWTTKEGEKIPIEEMATSHILNAIALFKDAKSIKEQVEWLKEEKNKRLGIIDEGPIKNRYDILDL